MNVEDLRKLYADLRRANGLTLREAANLLDVPCEYLTRIEVGKVPPLEVDNTKLVYVLCHRCQRKFYTHPVKDMIFASYVCKDCWRKDDSEG